ncbi:hypothetical protein N9N67_03520 [Bacteriovoracaceae bacterium]|nr:hypothetical protein [Bacteriovoracaceae bacterium]
MKIRSLLLILLAIFSISRELRAQQCANWDDEIWRFNINVEGYLNPVIQVMNSRGEIIDMRSSEISFIGFSLLHRRKNGNLAFELGFGTSYHLGMWNGHTYGVTSDGEELNATHHISGPFTLTPKFTFFIKLNPDPNYKNGKRKSSKYFVLGVEQLMHIGAGDEDLIEDNNGTLTVSNYALGNTRAKIGVNFGELHKFNYSLMLNYRFGSAKDIVKQISPLGVSFVCRVPIGGR